MGGLRERPLCLSTPHTSCITGGRKTRCKARPLPQHTTYGLHPVIHQHPLVWSHFASAHHIRAASAKLRREMDTAL